ncbi:AAA family ATPase [Staphylospora marina]|uniref:AAA family ATPase n=1 Tax=Staphylospora marina TaxID=2490858 RepID=UPI000F5BEC9A|nr:AAA family ATPase [Staphylospora marina]
MGRKVLAETGKNRIHVVFDHPTGRFSPEKKRRGETELFWQESEHGALSDCLEELSQLVGLVNIKEFVKEIYAWLEVGKRRKAAGLAADEQVLHMIFTGNPGTGKTTVARILGRLFKEMGVLSRGHLVEVERADLVGEYIGHTAQKTREHVRKALGGILFIDEAYSLARGGDKDFGKEAIDTLVKAMEDHKNDFILILAGYPEEMEWFLRLNPGLPSRFPVHLKFQDFTLEELLDIADRMVSARQYRLSLAARERLRRHLEEEMRRRDSHSGNARHVRNLVEQAIRQHAMRVIRMKNPDRDELMTLRGEDVMAGLGAGKRGASPWYNGSGVRFATDRRS